MLLDRLAAGPRLGSPAAVLEELRRVILDGGAPPGTPIPVTDLAQLLGVSPIPVREALKTLVGENLVQHRPNIGYVVAQLTRAELREIYVVRGVLEGAALRAAVLEATPDDVGVASAAHSALSEAIAVADPRAYHVHSRAFHLALIGPCRMRRLMRMFEAAWNVTEPFQPMRYVSGEDRRLLHEDHAEMLAAFASGDAERLVDCAAVHHKRLEGVIGRLPDDAGLLVD
ncbi:GntR family transcriptional regulator [Spongisporangium articulatum]|uniref:GntR family transcriptional regulator n=1 Tax=Spongisporangium articulatum TaxID=3362603 RepID=A0ABW8ARV3_9ACTN